MVEIDLSLVIFPDPILKTHSKELIPPFEQYKPIMNRMFELMYEHKGIGLAANQVGLAYRLFVMDVPPQEESAGDAPQANDNLSDAAADDAAADDVKRKPYNPRAFINPKILNFKNKVTSSEGCLSIPDVTIELARFNEIQVSYLDFDGSNKEEQFKGLEAICFQHEYDHINGKLIWDHLLPLSRSIAIKKYKKSNKS